MQAFFQGKIDNFCAMYAVLNAVQVLYGLEPLAARKIFNRALMELVRDTEAFRAVLEHRTDYVDLVDAMLADIKANEFPQLEVDAPLGPEASREEVWEVLRSCATPSLPRVSVFRFMRFAPPNPRPYVDHWTVGRFMDTAGLHFLDCSLEPGALHCLPYARLSDRSQPLSREYVVVAPESVRILSSTRPKTFALPV